VGGRCANCSMHWRTTPDRAYASLPLRMIDIRAILVRACMASAASWMALPVTCAQIVSNETHIDMPFQPTGPAERSFADWLLALRDAYSDKAVVELIRFEVAGAGSPVVGTDLWLRIDPGTDDDASPRVARLRIDAGRAIAWAQGDRLVLARADNPTTYTEHVIAGGLSGSGGGGGGGGLLQWLPQSPLPQIALAFGQDDAGKQPFRWDVRRCVWSEVERAKDGRSVQLRGTLDQQAASIDLDAATARLLAFEFSLGNGQVVRATVVRQVVEEPSTWPLALEGRTKLASAADLKPLRRKIESGQSVPTLGLMSKDLEGWSLADGLREAGNAAREPSVVAAGLVLVSASCDQTNLEAALRAYRGVARLVQELDAQHAQALVGSPKLIARVVGVLELRDVSRERIGALEGRWTAAALARGATPPQVLWTGAGTETLHQLAPAQSTGLVVIDDRQQLIGVITLEGRLLDEATIANELRAMLRPAPSPAPPVPQQP